MWITKWVLCACVDESHLNFKTFQRKFGALAQSLIKITPSILELKQNHFFILNTVITPWRVAVLKNTFWCGSYSRMTLVYFDRRGRSFSWWFKEQVLNYSFNVLANLSFASVERNYFFANIIFSPLTLITFVYFFEQIKISDQCKYSVWLRALWLIRCWFLFLIVLKMRRSFG